MSIAIAPQFTKKFYNYQDWKTVQMTKEFSTQYDEDSDKYTVYGYEEPEAHICVVWKNAVPDPIIASGYSQEQNDTDKAGFEASYKSTANDKIFKRSRYLNITSNATTVVKSSDGVLEGIVINNNTTGGTITVYDNTTNSGTKIMTMSIGTPTGGLLSNSGKPPPSFVEIGVEFNTGLTIVTAGSTANDITVRYK